LVKEEMEIPSHLLEHVANRIASKIEAEFEIGYKNQSKNFENKPADGRGNAAGKCNLRKIKLDESRYLGKQKSYYLCKPESKGKFIN
jgi:hypothetical protein